jgi:hypothetical protein
MNFTGKSINWHAGVVSREHEDYLVVGNPSGFKVLIENKYVDRMSIVKVEFTCGH